MRFHPPFSRARAFTLVELLVVIALIGILAALLLPTVNRSKASAMKTVCLNNLKQINLGLRMYADDNNGTLPITNHVGSAYKELMKHNVGLTTPSSPDDRLFACPADLFLIDLPRNTIVPGSIHDDVDNDYSSYNMNDLNRLGDPSAPGIVGKKISSIRE